MMYDSLERNLAEVAGLDDVETEAHSGRSRGPKFVWEDLCGTPASVRCRSTDVSRAWGLIADWLRQLADIMRLQARPPRHTAAATGATTAANEGTLVTEPRPPPLAPTTSKR